MKKYKIKILKTYWEDFDTYLGDVKFEHNGKEYTAFSHLNEFEEGKEYEVAFEIHGKNIINKCFELNKNRHKSLKLKNMYTKSVYQFCGKIKSIIPLVMDVGEFDINLILDFDDNSKVGNYLLYEGTFRIEL